MSISDVKRFTKTRFKSLVYRNGIIYNFVTQRLMDQKRKFQIIANHIGNGDNGGKHVLDMPCGTGYLARYLDTSITYEGWDLNHVFLKKIKNDWKKGRIKTKKVILQQKNIFDLQYIDDSKKDVIVLCDILHHIIPHHLKLVKLAMQNAKKVIICEPITVKRHEIQAYDWIGRLFIYLFKLLPPSLYKIMDFFLIDNDGINSFETRSKWIFNEGNIKNFFQNLGFRNIKKVSDSIICTWSN